MNTQLKLVKTLIVIESRLISLKDRTGAFLRNSVQKREKTRPNRRRHFPVRYLSLGALFLVALIPVTGASAEIFEASPDSITLSWMNWPEISPDAQAVWKRVVRETEEGQVAWTVCWPPTPTAQYPNLLAFVLCRSIDNFKLGWLLLIAEPSETSQALLILHQLVWDLYGIGKGEWLWAHSPMYAH